MKRIKFAAAAIAAMTIAFAAAAQDAASVVEKYTQAADLVNKSKDFAAAAPLFEQVIAEGTKVGADVASDVANAKKLLPQVYYLLASQQASKGQYSQAITSVTQAQKKAVEYKDNLNVKKAQDLLIKIYVKQGNDLFNAKKYAESVPFFEKAYAVNPNSADAAFYLATAYVESGKKTEGFAIYDKMIARGSDPRFKDAANQAQAKKESYQNIAASEAYNAKNYTQAISLADALIKENSKNANAQMIVVRSLNNLKKYGDLIQRAPAAIAAQGSDEDKSEIYFLVGVAYDNQKDTAKAIENFKKVTKGNYAAQAKTQVTELSKAS